MQESEIFIKIISYLLGAICSIIGFGVGIMVYVWKRHVRDNDRQYKENREDHIRMFDRIEKIESRRK